MNVKEYNINNLNKKLKINNIGLNLQNINCIDKKETHTLTNRNNGHLSARENKVITKVKK